MKNIGALLLLLACSMTVSGQVNSQRKAFEQRRHAAHKQFSDARKQALMNYAEAARKAWAEFEGQPAEEPPQDEVVIPVLSEDADAVTESWWSDQMNKLKNLYGKIKNIVSRRVPVKEVKDGGEALPIGKVIAPEPVAPQPQPLSVVEENEDEENDYFSFLHFGNDYRVRIGDNCRPVLPSLRGNDIAEAMKSFTQPQYDNLLHDCLKERKDHQLSDWAYYQMLQTLVNKFYGQNSNEGTLVMSFLYSQSGYKMRLAHDDSQLYMLAASRHNIFGHDYLVVDGNRYYLLDGRQLRGTTFYLCEASFPKESSMSLQMSKPQLFAQQSTPQRIITSKKNASFSFTITSNKNYLDFYATYPRSCIGSDVMTQWAMYAETPLEQGVCSQLYPAMREKLKGLSELDAVQELLWWVQTGLEYGYDDKIWGEDRPFFGEESLFYPFCDCEDRAILFSHLVRELVDLDVCLVYYPGHLAAAVAFKEDVAGDFFQAGNGQKFVVCDPTIIPGRVGVTMRLVEGKPATIMVLKRI